MKRVKSGFYNNSESKKTVNILNKTIKKKKKLTQSISERCVGTKNSIFPNNNNNSKLNGNYKVKKIDIKFNILNNIKNYKTIFNKTSYQKLVKNNQDTSNNNNTKFRLKLFNNIPNIPKLVINKNKLNNNFFYDLESEKDDNDNNTNIKNKQTQLDPHGYFPEDFSLNIYKSTSLYKNRYKIQTCRLKKVLKNIYQEENSKHTKNLNDIIKKNTIENNLSINMFKLLKAQKIDRFVNRLLNIKNNPFQNLNENSKDNININKIKDNFFLTNKNRISKKINNFNLDDLDNKSNAYIQPYSNINNEDLTNKYFSIKNFSIDNNNNNKSNTANSATQTMSVNSGLNNKYYYNNNIYEFGDKSFREQNRQNILNSNNNNNLSFKGKNYSCKEIKFEMMQFPKKKIFLKKNEKMIRPFSASKIDSSSSLNCKNNNIIKNFHKNKKLIFSFYDPKDKYIQLFEDLEKKEFDSHMNIKINSQFNK